MKLKRFNVYVNGKRIVDGLFKNAWHAWVVALDVYGLDKPVGTVKVEEVK